MRVIAITKGWHCEAGRRGERFWRTGPHASQHAIPVHGCGSRLGYIRNAVSEGKEYYAALAQTQSGSSNSFPVLASGVSVVGEMKVALQAIDHHMVIPQTQINSICTAAHAFNSNTVAVASVHPVDVSHAPQPVPEVPFFQGGNSLPERLKRFDPDLAKTCAQIWETQYGTGSDPVRSALYAARQTFDHFFGKLAPDDDVRASPYWKRKDGLNPNQVTRAERIRYAINNRVTDEGTRRLLEASTKHGIDTYQLLNQAHERGALDSDKARKAVAAMCHYLEQWADAIGL